MSNAMRPRPGAVILGLDGRIERMPFPVLTQRIQWERRAIRLAS